MFENGIDIVGDVHGNYSKLIKLLNKLGYRKQNGFKNQKRNIVFIGDIIDRGNENLKTLGLIKFLYEMEIALIVLGNHEYNAICYHREGDNDFLRSHNSKNFLSHKETLLEIKDKNDEWLKYIEWFMQFPLYLEVKNLRLVHACWDDDMIQWLRDRNIYSIDNNMVFLKNSVNKQRFEHKVIETVLKGPELNLPKNVEYTDRNGIKRNSVRIKWWIDKDEIIKYENLSQISLTDNKTKKMLKSFKINDEIKNLFNNKLNNDFIYLFGHYWFKGKPKPIKKNIACLDYSVAKGGKLVAYRYNGEQELQNSNFIYL